MRGGGHREPGLRGGEGPGLGPKRGPAGSAACTERSPRGRPASCRAPPAPGGGEEGMGSTGGARTRCLPPWVPLPWVPLVPLCGLCPCPVPVADPVPGC